MRGRKPSRREQIIKTNAAFRFLGALTGKDASPLLTPVPELRQRGAVNLDLAEAGVMQDIADLLRVHPEVLFAVRQNAGAMAAEGADGRLRPIWFYQWVRQPRKMRITDFWGFLRCGKPFAVEAKRRDYSGPSGQAETLRHEEQEAFLNFIISLGGRAGLARNVDEAKRIIDG